MAWHSSCSWLDTNGYWRKTVLTSSAGAPNTIADIQGLSNAGLQTFFEGLIIHPVPAPVAASAQDNVGYMTQLLMSDVGLNTGRIYWPCSDPAILNPDGQFLNAAAPALAALGIQLTLSGIIPFSGAGVFGTGAGWQTYRGQTMRDSLFVGGSALAPMQRDIVWVDFNGNTVVTTFEGKPGGGMGGIYAALTPLSQASPMSWWEGDIQYPLVAPVAAQYQSVWDAARIDYADNQGNRGSIVIPAAVAGIFFPDNETVDLTAAGVPGLIVDMKAELLVLSSGLACHTVIGGRRIKRGFELGA